MGSFYMESTQINYRRDETVKTVDQKLQELSETSAIDTDIAPVFKSTNTYAPGDMVYYRNKLYVFNVEHTGAWAAADVTATDVTTELSSLKSGLTNAADDVQLNTNDLTTPSRTKNLLPMTLNYIKSRNTSGTWDGNSYTINGITFTVLTDDAGNVSAIKINGTASADIFYFYLAVITTTNTKIFSTGNIYGWSQDGKVCELHQGSTSIRPSVYNGVEFSAGSWECTIAIKSGTTLNNELWYPMVRNTDENSNFTPYIPSVETRLEAVETQTSITATKDNTNIIDVYLDSCVKKGGVAYVYLVIGTNAMQADATLFTLDVTAKNSAFAIVIDNNGAISGEVYISKDSNVIKALYPISKATSRFYLFFPCN